MLSVLTAHFGANFRRLSAQRVALALFGAGIVGIFTAAPAIAQESAAPTSVKPSDELCRIFTADQPGNPEKQLRVSCKGRALMLGPVSSYQVFNYRALGATLVDARHNDERRVLMVSVPEEGKPLLEDLTGQIALAAGRGPMSDLVGVELDLGRFARDGTVDVRKGDKARAATSENINLTQQIATERSRSKASSNN